MARLTRPKYRPHPDDAAELRAAMNEAADALRKYTTAAEQVLYDRPPRDHTRVTRA